MGYMIVGYMCVTAMNIYLEFGRLNGNANLVVLI